MTNRPETKRHKVLHLITGMEVGGAEKMLLRLVPPMEGECENRVCVIKGRGALGARLEDCGIPVTYLELRRSFDLRSIVRFKRLVDEFKPDILVTYLIHADLFGRILGRAFGIRKVACYQRGSLLNWEFLRIVDRLTKPLVAKYITQTETAKEELKAALRISGDLIAVIGNAVNRAAFDFTIDTSAKKRELGLDPESKNIVCVGNLRQGKGHEYLLDAFEKLSLKRFPGVNLLIAGDGQMSRTLLSQVKSYTSQANIHFLGNRDDIAEILKISDIFVLPTLYEGMSNAILEAMASKVAVITTDIPVNIELVGDTAIVVPVRNPDTLAEAMQTLLLNDALREDLAQRAYAKITSQYSLEVIVERYITLIKAIINA